MENKLKLKNKLKQKKADRMNKGSSQPEASNFTETDNILKMMEQVNKILKTNPELVKQVSKCVGEVMNDKNLMESLAEKINIQDQTLDNNTDDDETEATSKE